MTNEQFSAGDYAIQMSELLENLIVKSGKSLPSDVKISGDTIKTWKKYTIRYFKHSPDIFLAENEFFKELNERMKVKLVKENLADFRQKNMILSKFYHMFDTLWNDYQLNFKADDILICRILSCLQY